MKITAKFGLVSGVCLFLVTLLIMLQISAGGDSQKLLQIVRTMPAWLFYGFMLLVLILFIFLFKIFWWDLPRAGTGTKSLAEEIAKQKWYVKQVSIFESKIAWRLDSKGWQKINYASGKEFVDGAVLKLSSTDRSRQELILTFRPTHPSVKMLKNLTYLNIMELQFVEKPLECALDTELCAYLMVKT